MKHRALLSSDFSILNSRIWPSITYYTSCGITNAPKTSHFDDYSPASQFLGQLAGLGMCEEGQACCLAGILGISELEVTVMNREDACGLRVYAYIRMAD